MSSFYMCKTVAKFFMFWVPEMYESLLWWTCMRFFNKAIFTMDLYTICFFLLFVFFLEPQV